MNNFDINNHVNELIAAGYIVDGDGELYWWITEKSFSKFYKSSELAWIGAWEHFKSLK